MIPYISDYQCCILVIILFCFQAPTRLERPVLDLDLTTIYPNTEFNRVCALPGGEAVINNNTNSRHQQVLRINSQGQVVKMLYDCPAVPRYMDLSGSVGIYLLSMKMEL